MTCHRRGSRLSFKSAPCSFDHPFPSFFPSSRTVEDSDSLETLPVSIRTNFSYRSASAIPLYLCPFILQRLSFPPKKKLSPFIRSLAGSFQRKVASLVDEDSFVDDIVNIGARLYQINFEIVTSRQLLNVAFFPQFQRV